MSNYARPGATSRHNEAYWRGEWYLGLGAGAVGCAPVSADGRAGERWRNDADAAAYCERIEADHQSEEEQAFATLSALAEARNFGLIREQGRMVFTRKREKPRPSGRGGRAQARAASRWLGG